MTQQINVVMAQINFVVGDIEGNTNAIIQYANNAASDYAGHIIVFPELALTGYPPEDLLLRPSLEIRVNKAIAKIKSAQLPIVCVIGYPQHEHGKLYNSLMVLQGDQLLANYQKQCLPNYQVFDERRYFEKGSYACVVPLFGVNIAFTICEDMWEPEPVAQARAAKADLMININASPFHMGKQTLRQNLLFKRSDEGGFPIVYVNLIGGKTNSSSMAVPWWSSPTANFNI